MGDRGTEYPNVDLALPIPNHQQRGGPTKSASSPSENETKKKIQFGSSKTTEKAGENPIREGMAGRGRDKLLLLV
ncbi:hypothetical protein HDU97_006426, partial [Phlyctochytrium planicorne]